MLVKQTAEVRGIFCVQMQRFWEEYASLRWPELRTKVHIWLTWMWRKRIVGWNVWFPCISKRKKIKWIQESISILNAKCASCKAWHILLRIFAIQKFFTKTSFTKDKKMEELYLGISGFLLMVLTLFLIKIRTSIERSISKTYAIIFHPDTSACYLWIKRCRPFCKMLFYRRRKCKGISDHCICISVDVRYHAVYLAFVYTKLYGSAAQNLHKDTGSGSDDASGCSCDCVCV